ncbi:IQ domain-containing protein C [Alosa pseudoharengus]|uniref:IQ domain-containing protein C n=1 Tax=Alosa pseudoharengus TaxID=34774 RepID=UPI003F8B2552
MERKEWMEKITRFQACCRGYLMRRAMKYVRNDYEDIVKEIEGDLNDLQWRGGIIQIPTFPEESVSFLGHGRHAKVRSNTQPEREVEKKHEPPHIEVIEPERDSLPSASAEGVSRLSKVTTSLSDGGTVGESEPCQGEERERTHKEETIKDTTAALSRLGLDPSIIQKDSLRRSLDKDPPRTREEARMLRNKLAMELLWIQQAIASRKKYLSLRKNLEDGTQQLSTAAST